MHKNNGSHPRATKALSRKEASVGKPQNSQTTMPMRRCVASKAQPMLQYEKGSKQKKYFSAFHVGEAAKGGDNHVVAAKKCFNGGGCPLSVRGWYSNALK